MNEIRFNLLAIGQRLLPRYISQLNDLNNLDFTLIPHLDSLVPDWKTLVEFVKATESPVNYSLLAQAIDQGAIQELLSLKKALNRDITLLKSQIIDEEQKVSQYTVVSLSTKLMLGSRECAKD